MMEMKKHGNLTRALAILLMAALFAGVAAGCGSSDSASQPDDSSYTEPLDGNQQADLYAPSAIKLALDTEDEEETEDNDGPEDEEETEDAEDEDEDEDEEESEDEEDLLAIPEYDGEPYVAVNDNVPFFTEEDYTTESYEFYSDLDDLGRCGYCMACVGQDLMPTEERDSISSVTPTGWTQAEYDIVSGGYLYNRCHLIAYELAGENANEKNLITGTRYFNVTGMLPFENMVADYVEETDNHVLYRVTPVFEDENLVADGVLMEAMSMEDEGEDILFCVFVYNVQPGVVIDYATGESWLEDGGAEEDASDAEETEEEDAAETATSGTTYILNTNTMKFHYPDCSSVNRMSEKNKEEYTGSREDLIAMGYSPCGNCNP